MAVVLGVSSGFVITAPTADPTGGVNTTIDGSSVVTKHTSLVGAIAITEIGWYRGAGTNTANFEIALYSESGGVAATRLFVDATNSSNVQGWVVTAVNWAISENTAYWLAVQMDAHTGSSTIDSETSGGAGIDVLTSQTALADPYGGGAVSDADGMMAIYAKVSVQRNITAGLGAIVLTGIAPTVTATNHKNITVDLGVLTLAGFNPTVSVSNNLNLTPSFGEIAINGFEPVVSVTNNRNITADVGLIMVSGFTPTVELPKNTNPSTGELSITGFNPTVSVSDHKNIIPSFGEVTINGFSPSVSTTSGVNPENGSLTLSGFSPTINISVSASPETGVITVSGFSPTVSTPRNILPGFGELSIEGFAPVVDNGVGGPAMIVTSTGELIIQGYAPNVEGGNNEFLNINTPFDSGSFQSNISDSVSHSTISRVRRKSKIENDI